MGKDTGTYLLLGFGALAVGLGIKYGNKATTAIVTKTVTKMSKNKIDTLHPKLRPYAEAFINKARNMGHNVIITSGYRTHEEQTELYSYGRTKFKDANGNKKGIVTYAQAGESFHNFGLAFDFVEIVGGVAQWQKTPWDKLGKLGKEIGLEWGGDWPGKKKDMPHFQMKFNKTLAQLQTLYKNKNFKDGYVNVG